VVDCNCWVVAVVGGVVVADVVDAGHVVGCGNL